MLKDYLKNDCLTVWNDLRGCIFMLTTLLHLLTSQMTGILSSGVTACRTLNRAFLLGHSAFQPSTSDIPSVDYHQT